MKGLLTGVLLALIAPACGSTGSLPVLGYDVREQYDEVTGSTIVAMTNNHVGKYFPLPFVGNNLSLDAVKLTESNGNVLYLLNASTSSDYYIESLVINVDGDPYTLTKYSNNKYSSIAKALFLSPESLLRRIAYANEILVRIYGGEDIITKEFDDNNKSRYREWYERFVVGIQTGNELAAEKSVPQTSDGDQLRTVTVSAQMANLRSEGNLESQVVLVVARGTELEVLNVQNDWYEVRLVKSRNTGSIGFIHRSVVREAQ